MTLFTANYNNTANKSAYGFHNDGGLAVYASSNNTAGNLIEFYAASGVNVSNNVTYTLLARID